MKHLLYKYKIINKIYRNNIYFFFFFKSTEEMLNFEFPLAREIVHVFMKLFSNLNYKSSLCLITPLNSFVRAFHNNYSIFIYS